jgi:hypothetical protein
MRRILPDAVACSMLLLLLAAPGAMRAQQPDVPPLGQPDLFVPAFHRARALMIIGAGRPDHVLALLAATAKLEEQFEATAGAAIAGQGVQGPYPSFAALAAANRLGIVPLPEVPQPFEPDEPKPIEKAEPLLAHLIQGVRDDRPSATNWYEGLDEQYAFSNVLVVASGISAEAFREGARRDLTYAHVFNHPSKYRGQVVHIEGTLRQLRRYDPPATAKAARVTDLYEGWVFDPERFGADPWCIIFTELPAGVTPGEKASYSVAFDGYLFKRYQYESRGTRKGTKQKDWPRAPLLIGRTVTLTAAPDAAAAADSDWTGWLTPIFLSLVAGSIAVAFGLSYWFRRGDRRVRERVTAAANREFVEPEVMMNDAANRLH